MGLASTKDSRYQRGDGCQATVTVDCYNPVSPCRSERRLRSWQRGLKPTRNGVHEALAGLSLGCIPELDLAGYPIEVTKITRTDRAEKIDVRLETAKGCHKVFDLAVRRGFAGFKVTLNAQSGEEGKHHLGNCRSSHLRLLRLDVHGKKTL